MSDDYYIYQDRPIAYQDRAAAPRTSSSTPDFVESLKDAVRENPVSAALITMGVVWLFAGGAGTSMVRSLTSHTPGSSGAARAWRPARAVSVGVHRAEPVGRPMQTGSGNGGRYATEHEDHGPGRFSQAGSAIRDAGSSAASHVSSAMSSAYEELGHVTERAGSMMHSAGESLYRAGEATRSSGVDMMQSVRQDLGDLFERQPLLLGAAGLAIGAGIAASLPVTSTERNLVGAASDSLKDEVVDLVSGQIDHARQSVEAALREVRREAEAQGLSEAGIADAIKQFTEKLSGLGSSAKDRVTGELGAVMKN